MKLIDYMWKHDENKNLKVYRDGDLVAFYDGKESIPECYNDCEVITVIYDGKYTVCIEIA